MIKIQVTHQCKLRFVINANYIKEVEFDVVHINIIGVVLGSPYLFDKDVIYYRKNNEYHFIKEGRKFVVRSHVSKISNYTLIVRNIKDIINNSKKLTLMIIK